MTNGYYINRVKIFMALLIVLVLLASGKCGRKNAEDSDLLQIAWKHLEVPVNIYIRNLPDLVSESSALVLHNDLFWTINDSGGDPVIFGLSKDIGNVVHTVTLENAENHDWEALTTDGNYWYTGDFGNNSGIRTDLCIYKFSGEFLSATGDTSLTADKISFSYEDQDNFNKSLHRTAYDCEAMIVMNDSIFLFTKDWVNEFTTIYRLPAKPGNYKAKKIAVLNARGLITGATYKKSTNQLALLGYKNFVPFVIYFNSFSPYKVNKGSVYRFNFSDIEMAQTEGITFGKDHALYLSSEKNRLPGHIFRIDLTILNL